LKRRRSEDVKPSPAPTWIVSFADLMTLLLGFFVALVSFSSFENERFKEALGSVKMALQAPFSAAPASNSTMTVSIQEQIKVEEDAVETASEVRELAEKNGLGGQITAEATSEGVRISLSNPILFDEGKDELHVTSQGFLSGLAKVISERNPAGVIIEGHTDDTPIHSERFPSNWELSAARALRVLKLFQGEGVSAEKMAAIGYAEFRPKVDVPKDATGLQKSVNRRVEIVLQLKAGQGGIFAPRPAVRNDSSEE